MPWPAARAARRSSPATRSARWRARRCATSRSWRAASTLPVLRPLIDRDKSEIIDEAERLGTFETSILPDEDCCTLLAPGRAVTWTDPEPLIELERRVDVETVVEQLVDQALVMWPRVERSPGPPRAAA